ncbi:hypothetical protein DM860_000932 [Cuscuta australis]|uniref:Uncharacterized protein n=1 Tax=Cuscuta australis TaxID=267555 RepID=A0A328DSI4_9ASTE|nr:hypothetical protein DM860_000932 [Cuscuta australis]
MHYWSTEYFRLETYRGFFKSWFKRPGLTGWLYWSGDALGCYSVKNGYQRSSLPLVPLCECSLVFSRKGWREGYSSIIRVLVLAGFLFSLPFEAALFMLGLVGLYGRRCNEAAWESKVSLPRATTM